MARRFLIALVELVAVVLLSYLLAAASQLIVGAPPADAFLSGAPRLIFVFMDVGLIVWALLLVLGAVRGRGLGHGLGGGILAAAIAAVANLIVVTVIALVQGGADIFYIAIGVAACILFLVAAFVVVPLVQRAFRAGGPRNAPADGVATPSPTP